MTQKKKIRGAELVVLLIFVLILIGGVVCISVFWGDLKALTTPADDPTKEEQPDADLKFDRSKLVFGKQTSSSEKEATTYELFLEVEGENAAIIFYAE